MSMKVLGGKNLPSYWERFDRLQRTDAKLLGSTVHPRGVFRFSSFEEFETWKENLYPNRPDRPSTPPSKHSNADTEK